MPMSASNTSAGKPSGIAPPPAARRASPGRALRRFRRDEGGTATIESLLWLPLFFFLLVMIVNGSFIFYGKSQALRIIQDANRALSTGRLGNTGAAETYLRTRIGVFAPSVLTDPSRVDTTVTAGIITSSSRIPLGELAVLGSFSLFTTGTLVVQSQHYLEF